MNDKTIIVIFPWLDIPFEVCTIPLTRTEQGHVTLCDVILPSQPTTNVRQTNSGIASLSPDSVEGRKINRYFFFLLRPTICRVIWINSCAFALTSHKAKKM